MRSSYTCKCGRSALYGEVHVCPNEDDYYVTYLNEGDLFSDKPLYLTYRKHFSFRSKIFYHIRKALFKLESRAVEKKK